jgi:lysozyme
MSVIDTASQITMMFEGFRTYPYLCPAGVWTIGYGTTRYPNGKKVQSSDMWIPKTLAAEYLRQEIVSSINQVLKCCPILSLHESRLAAITDFVYNLGAGRLQASTLRRRINQGDWVLVKTELMKWVRGGRRILPGLVARRKVECGLI